LPNGLSRSEFFFNERCKQMFAASCRKLQAGSLRSPKEIRVTRAIRG
jgi:hypothetical protein